MDMIFVLDQKMRFVEINDAGVTTLGCRERNDLVGKDIQSFFVAPEEYGLVMSELTYKGFVRDKECKMRARGGAELHIMLSATSRRDRCGRILSCEGVAKDITARVEMERQLQRADKLASLGQISTGIAHEINNPLGVILGYTQLLLRDHQSGTQVYEDLKVIEKHARNCKNIVEDLLKFARGAKTEKKWIDVNDTVSEVLSLLDHQLELDKIAVKQDLAGDIPKICADGEKLKQVFMNLLMNARQAITGPGTISVETSADGETDSVHVTISDSGCGIPSEAMDKIFDPFFTTKPVGFGTGLGLSVSYGIVQDHNGRIEVKSDPGKGSAFTVIVPLGPCAETEMIEKV
jgi:two-component system, NtrC family, sensor kinase